MSDSSRRGNDPLDLRPAPAARREQPPAPGAVRSPQMPGQVPDRSSVPGHATLPVPPATEARPPLTEFGTAQRIMRVFVPAPGQEHTKERWEQATASFEEVRKGDLSLLPPMRPAPGFAISAGEVDVSPLLEAEGLETPPAVVTAAAGQATAPAAQTAAPATPPAATAAPLDRRLATIPQTGWVPGDGTRACPPAYPVKGNAGAKTYFLRGQPAYETTIPELCFSSAEAAEAAGFHAAKQG